MKWTDVIWIEGRDGNVEHIEANDVTSTEVEEVIQNPISIGKSRRSGLPIAFGYTSNHRHLAVIYVEIDEVTVFPITAYDVED